MSTVLESRLRARVTAPRVAWLAVAAGLALLYVPTYATLAEGAWREDAHAHGPLILAVVAWLLWRGRAALSASAPAPVAGGVALAAGLALWLLGRTQSIVLFEVASHLPVVAGLVLLAGGWTALRRLAFPVLFLFFVIPLPGFIVDAATTPLKNAVSAGVESLLLLLGYPVERQGVVLAIGQHEMLVADACSGLNSIVSLFALGLLYLHLTGPRRRAHSFAVLAAIVPIAVVANMLRVLALVLLTVHFGADVSQGWAHGALGMMVFVVAFGMMLGVDRLMGGKGREKGLGQEAAQEPAERFQASRLSLIVATAAMATAAAAAPGLRPMPDPMRSANIEALIPESFAGWRIDPAEMAVAPAPDVQANLARLYSQVVNRTYVNEAGERILLTVAYGGDQSDALKAHRQEVCYSAQGFEIHGAQHARMSTTGRELPVTRFHALRPGRSEPVTYWFTLGDRVVRGRGERLVEQLRHGFQGRVPDGMMVRVSSLSTDVPGAYAAHQGFVASLLGAVGTAEATRLAGRAQSH
jgi:exosortase B